jgi:hypothetical protein
MEGEGGGFSAMRNKECPKCGEDISDSYEGHDPSVGIMCGGWFCEVCDLFVAEEDEQFYDED